MAVHTVFLALLLLLYYCVVSSESKSISSISYQFPEQWQAWKVDHLKNYTSQLEELDRHLVWLSNKKYIESHNAYSHIFGYTLELNQFADMVRLCTHAARSQCSQCFLVLYMIYINCVQCHFIPHAHTNMHA